MRILALALLALAAAPLAACATFRDIGDVPGARVRMPVEEHPALGGGADAFVVIYSGDGGSRGGNRVISADLAARGVAVVDIDSLSYFWRSRPAARAAKDLAAVIDHYARVWHANQVVLAGYSFGGSALPAIARELPAQARSRVRAMILIAPRDYVELTLRPHSWINIKPAHAPPLTADLETFRRTRVVCIYGEKDGLAACPRLPPGLAEPHKLPGGHKFDGDYAAVAALVEAEAR
jgi:type IV secretory pathway VirJ component